VAIGEGSGVRGRRSVAGRGRRLLETRLAGKGFARGRFGRKPFYDRWLGAWKQAKQERAEVRGRGSGERTRDASFGTEFWIVDSIYMWRSGILEFWILGALEFVALGRCKSLVGVELRPVGGFWTRAQMSFFVPKVGFLEDCASFGNWSDRIAFEKRNVGRDNRIGGID
jgi:hypothetical protein